MFIFGYGSLVWNPNFPYVKMRWGFIKGWKRRFWQQSPDHRGTPENMGRVATLVRHGTVHEADEFDEGEGGTCWGVLYEVDSKDEIAVLEYLNVREVAGYEIVYLDVFIPRGGSGVEDLFITYNDDGNEMKKEACDDGHHIVVKSLVYTATSENEHFIGGKESMLDCSRVIATAKVMRVYRSISINNQMLSHR